MPLLGTLTFSCSILNYYSHMRGRDTISFFLLCLLLSVNIHFTELLSMLAHYMYMVETIATKAVMFHNSTCHCEMCSILKLQSMLLLSFLPTKIVGLEAFKWSDRLKVCYSGNKLKLILVSIQQLKSSQILEDVNRSM